MKKFKLHPDQIVRLIEPIGAATATDMITVEGRDVGYMYRESALAQGDTGWRFFSGDEDESYINNIENIGIYNINTIANCDPSIIAYLNEPSGSAWERIAGTNRFERVK